VGASSGFQTISICPQLGLGIQIGPTGKTVLPLTVKAAGSGHSH
jgi:hypothetical protein